MKKYTFSKLRNGVESQSNRKYNFICRDEMIPSWFNLKDLPFQEMWKDDQYWMPLFLAVKFTFKVG